MSHPKQSKTVHVEMLNDELCLYDWQRKEVHALNPTAATVWQLCDGQTSPQHIAGQLKGDLNAEQAEALVWASLEQLRRANLLEGEIAKPAGRPVLTRRQMLKVLGGAAAGAALLPVISSIVAPTPVAAQSPVPPGSQTFDFTGAEQTFAVPAGVTSVTVEAFGARGGGDNYNSSVGGLGGSTVATIAVTSGETLFVYVGGQGGDGSPPNGGVGGFNGGGNGGNTRNLAHLAPGGGGGGASDVRQGGNGLVNRVVVAGGGGGGHNQGSGGRGGGPIGEDGDDSSHHPTTLGGGGGTQSSGGTGGNGGTNGGDGSSGTGGNGGGGALAADGGGGGGGGYFGGGGGGGDDDYTVGGTDGGAGGGGGSSFAIGTATGVTHQQGARAGNGQVIISW